MYKLSETQHNQLKKQILTIINQEATKKTKKSQMIYKTRYSRKILQSLHQERKRMKDSFLNKIQIIQISDYVI